VPDVIEGGGRPTANTNHESSGTRELPLLGKIAAGTPISAIQHERDRMAVPEALLGAGEHYLLEIEGDSMIEAGILGPGRGRGSHAEAPAQTRCLHRAGAGQPRL